MRRPGNNSFEMPEFIQSHSMRVPVSLRPLTGADYDEWNEVRWRNDAWLKPWESGDPLHGAPITYKEWMKQLRRNERAGTGAVFAIEQHGRRFLSLCFTWESAARRSPPSCRSFSLPSGFCGF